MSTGAGTAGRGIEPGQLVRGTEPGAGWIGRPASDAPVPAVVVLPPIAGITPYVRAVTADLVGRGWACLALDYYHRLPEPPDTSTPEKTKEAVLALSDPDALADLARVLASFREKRFVRADRVAVLGFCIGGAYALLAAADDPSLSCAVSFYGLLGYERVTPEKPRSALDVASEIACPILGHFGDQDARVPVGHVKQLREALRGNVAEIYVYPGAGHAFHEHHRPDMYRPVAAATAWSRTICALRWHLRGGEPAADELPGAVAGVADALPPGEAGQRS